MTEYLGFVTCDGLASFPEGGEVAIFFVVKRHRNQIFVCPMIETDRLTD